ncbi:unannotated protein [freshwater metagenome]|uniref:Unannotated protein n=1 Tax=freshwater metagenome TaxID=449393 RepID=A0A6J7I7C3_9ZZZZ
MLGDGLGVGQITHIGVNQLRVDNFKHCGHVRTRAHGQQRAQHVIPDRTIRKQDFLTKTDQIHTYAITRLSTQLGLVADGNAINDRHGRKSFATRVATTHPTHKHTEPKRPGPQGFLI